MGRSSFFFDAVTDAPTQINFEPDQKHLFSEHYLESLGANKWIDEVPQLYTYHVSREPNCKNLSRLVLEVSTLVAQQIDRVMSQR